MKLAWICGGDDDDRLWRWAERSGSGFRAASSTCRRSSKLRSWLGTRGYLDNFKRQAAPGRRATWWPGEAGWRGAAATSENFEGTAGPGAGRLTIREPAGSGTLGRPAKPGLWWGSGYHGGALISHHPGPRSGLGELGVGGGAWWLGEAGGRGREGHRAVTFAEASMLRANSCGHGEENRGWSAELLPERSPAKPKGRSLGAFREISAKTTKRMFRIPVRIYTRPSGLGLGRSGPSGPVLPSLLQLMIRASRGLK